MDPIAKGLIIFGVVLIVAGVAWHFGWIQALRLGKLPGDISVESKDSSFYFPITTCILLSLVISAIMWIFKK